MLQARSLTSLLLATSFGSTLGHLARLLRLVNRLDDSYSNGLLHVTDGETTQWWVLLEGLHTHRLGWGQLDDGSITRLDGLGVVLKLLATTTIDLLLELVEFAGNVSSVAIQHWCVSSMDLSWMVQDDDLYINRVKIEIEIKIFGLLAMRNTETTVFTHATSIFDPRFTNSRHENDSS